MSQFIDDDSDFRVEEPGAIDFNEAVKLPGGGSTCHIYRTRWQRREVFVKRLKEPLRTKPLYLDAFDKEFETGVGLRHPSLPEYRELHRDYIVMDYIDGATLADMIRKRDPWLTSEKNIVKMLRQLVDVVGYLHCHNVTHCDIKPSNIMITARNRNLVLVDLDKCYTDALNDSSGDPAKYGVAADLPGDVAIDFQGIAMTVERLKESVEGFRFRRYQRFVDACRSADATTDQLVSILDYNPSAACRARALIIVAAAALAIIGAAVVYLCTSHADSEPAPSTIPEPTAPQPAIAEPEKDAAEPTVEPLTIEPKTSPVVEQDDLHAEARAKAKILDRRIKPMYDDLLANLDRLQQIKEDPTLTADQLLEALRSHGDKEAEVTEELFAILHETFPADDDRTLWRTLSYSTVYTGYNRQAKATLKAVDQERQRRQ